jgi:uncharacterized protein
MSRISIHGLTSHFLIRIFLGILIIAGCVVSIELAGRFVLKYLFHNQLIINLIIAITESVTVVFAYILFVSKAEDRQVDELEIKTLLKSSLAGFGTGFLLQSSFILVILIFFTYSIERINGLNDIIPSFTNALTAGFVTELIFRGLIFRITEQKYGSITALTFITLLFAVFHINAQGASPVTVLAAAIIYGLLQSSVYVLTRNLWFPIFMHFGWDFTEPGIFGAINPGNNIGQGLFTSRISGPELITGGLLGPQNSLQSLLICLAASIIILYLARKNILFRHSQTEL